MSYLGQYPNAETVVGTIDKITPDIGAQVLPDVNDNVNIVGGVGVSTDGSTPNQLTIHFTGGTVLSWNIVTSATQALSSKNGYIPNYAGAVTFTLPVSSEVGDVIRISQNIGATLSSHIWKISQNAGQSIIVNDDTTTIGVIGYISAYDILHLIPRTSIELVCVEANLKWLCVSLSSGQVSIL